MRVHWSGTSDEFARVAVLLHGRGSHVGEPATLASHLPGHVAVVAPRGPVVLGAAQFTWFENRGIGRPLPGSRQSSIEPVSRLARRDARATPGGAGGLRWAPVGSGGGCAFAAGCVLDDPSGFADAAQLYGTIPFDAGVATTPQRLAGVPIVHAQGSGDPVMSPDLTARGARVLTP